MEQSVHNTVLLKKAVDLLNVKPGDTCVDLTLGGGGHSKEILKKLKKGKLIAFDKDINAIRRFANLLKEEGFKSEENINIDRVIKLKKGLVEIYIVNRDFSKLKDTLHELGIKKANGILADLGLSSDQLDKYGKGFSFHKKEMLDMRMSDESNVTAKDLVNVLGEKQLEDIFRKYGDEPNAKRIAKRIVQVRSQKKIETTVDLLQIINDLALKLESRRNLRGLLPATRVFQALRIVVNQEIDSLESVLPQTLEVVVAGSKLVIISFHSGEDRVVKNFFRNEKQKGNIKLINKKPLTPDDEEVEKNRRSRSAKLRAAEKIK